MKPPKDLRSKFEAKMEEKLRKEEEEKERKLLEEEQKRIEVNLLNCFLNLKSPL